MNRTVKVLLALIAVALWGLLLRPYLSIPAAQAAPTAMPSSTGPAIATYQNYVFVVQGGRIYTYIYDMDASYHLTFKAVRGVDTRP